MITKGVEPVIQAHYKHSKVKQYFEEGRALRTETTVNDPYDFGVRRTLTADTWQQLRAIGDQINDRLLDAQLQACQCAPDPTTLTRLVSPSIEDGQPAPALHFGDPRVMALFACLCLWVNLCSVGASTAAEGEPVLCLPITRARRRPAPLGGVRCRKRQQDVAP